MLGGYYSFCISKVFQSNSEFFDLSTVSVPADFALSDTILVILSAILLPFKPPVASPVFRFFDEYEKHR